MSSSWETLARVIKLGYNNFWRNRWLTLGATLLMTLTLVMISVSLLMTFMIRDTASAVRSSINLTIYFQVDAVADKDIEQLGKQIGQLPDVLDVTFITKNQALSIFKRLPINQNVKDPINEGFNPLPRSLEIATSDVEQIQSIVAQIEKLDSGKIICGECVSYTKNKDIVDQLISSTRTAQQAGWLLSGFFGLIAIFNVYNIIRLTIGARSDEIEIMRYVGASNSFVRGPFVVEGVLYGLLGTIATSALLPLLSYIITRYRGNSGLTTLGSAFGVLNTDLYQYVMNHFWSLVALQLVVGVVLGILVSVLSVRRYLRA
ncbi:MAG: ABC transporter permease [Candidatus Berkelbacteria bacterium]|nr:MAG: ABC transporter permease [Candidatus Berkelbacteria bacterium]QQG51866.1 MAG: ABC transporter permease [Candidatus Berkelbacteria bacterium]